MADLPNGAYEVVIHYGCWNTAFGTNYIVEGVESGAIAATDASKYVTKVMVEVGVLDVKIAKGSASFGGYINGMEISPTTIDSTPIPDSHATIKEGVYYLKNVNNSLYLDVHLQEKSPCDALNV